MTQWLIILGFALTAGFLLLHGFGKSKQTSDSMLDAYRDLLNQAEEKDKDDPDNDKNSCDSPADAKPL